MIKTAFSNSFREDPLRLGYGVTVKTVRGKRYVYFWFYDGKGRKTEKYLGPAEDPETEKRALKMQLEYLQNVKREVEREIEKIRKLLEKVAAQNKT